LSSQSAGSASGVLQQLMSGLPSASSSPSRASCGSGVVVHVDQRSLATLVPPPPPWPSQAPCGSGVAVHVDQRSPASLVPPPPPLPPSAPCGSGAAVHAEQCLPASLVPPAPSSSVSDHTPSPPSHCVLGDEPAVDVWAYPAALCDQLAFDVCAYPAASQASVALHRRRAALPSSSSSSAHVAEQCDMGAIVGEECCVSQVQCAQTASGSESSLQYSITSMAQLSPQGIDELLEMLAVRLRSTSALQQLDARSVSQDLAMRSASSVEQRLMPTGSAADGSALCNGSSGRSRGSSDTPLSQWHGPGSAVDDGSCLMVQSSDQQRSITSSGAHDGGWQADGVDWSVQQWSSPSSGDHGGSWQADAVDWSRGRGGDCGWQWSESA